MYITYNKYADAAMFCFNIQTFIIIFLGFIVEFKESSYAVIEDVSIYNVTVVKQGISMQDIDVYIIPTPETARRE